MDETLNINLTNDEYPILEVSLVQAVGPKGDDGGWFNLKGGWSLGIAYVPYDLVNTITGSYVCVAANIDSEPTVNNPDWMRLIHTVTDESKIDKTSIKQTLGTSTTDLLSQNIISTNINRIDNELSNKTDVSQLSNYYTKSQTYNKSEIDSITGGFNTVVVDDIVEMTDENTIYLISKNTPEQNNIYDKYIVFEGTPELLTDISKSNLSNFITFNDLNRYVSDVDLNNLIRDYYNKNSVYNKTEIDNLLANLNLEIDTSGFATIELLGEYIPFSKIKQSTGSSNSDLMSQKAITDLINSILNELQDDLGDRPTRPQLDDYLRDRLLGKPDDLREPGDILDDKIDDKIIAKLGADDLDAYIKGTLLGVEITDPRSPNIILNNKFAEKLDTNGLNTALSTTSTITTINNSLSNKVDAVSGSRLITSAEGTLLQNAIQPGTLSEHYKATYSDLVDKTDDLVNDKYFIRAFDETSGDEIKMSTLSLRNSLSIIYPTARELESTGDKFDGETYDFSFNHNFIEDSAKLNKNGLIYYKGHGFNIENGNTISLDVAPTSEDIIFIEAVYLD